MAPFDVYDAAGVLYDHPFFGGLVVPRPQFVDIDGDGDLDLFVHERSDELMFFENIGTAAEHRYVWRTDRWQDLSVGEWTRFVDIDGDGLFDLLAEELYSYVRVYRNEGSAHDPRMVQLPDSLRTSTGSPIFADRQNIPAFHDIDCNNRLDLFIGRIDGTVARLESEEDHQPGELPRFRMVAERFEGIEIIGEIVRPTRHGANSMFFADANGNGVKDLYWGDFFEAGLLLLENRGTCTNPLFNADPVAVYDETGQITTSGFNAPFLTNFDGGDLPDLFIGVLGGAYNPILTSSENFHHYRNDGEGGFELMTRRFLYGIDVGNESVPAIGDIDGNGTLDLIVGNKIDPASPETGRLYWYENIGTVTAPSFQLRDTLDLVRAFHQAPTIGNLWGDELPGLVLGTYTQGIHFFRNIGTAGKPQFVLQDSMTIQLTRGSNATPALADMDGDGLLDLVVGRSNGALSFYRNIGTPTRPAFELVSDQWMDIREGRRSHPTFYDLNGDGLLDLIVGREESGAGVYMNTGTAREPRFEPDDRYDLALHPYAAPVFADLHGDGIDVLIAGGGSGGLIYLERR